MSRGRHLHQAVAISAALFSLITFTAASIQAANIQLNWDAPTADAEADPLTAPAGYRVYVGQSSGSYDFILDVGDVLSIILDGLEEGQTYYVTVTAYDSAHAESDFSNEVSVLAGSTLSRPEGLVAAYSFDEGSGITAADVSGNGNDGVISGAVWTTSARFGNALLFDGVDDLVTIEDSPSLRFSDGFTLSAWVFPGAMQSGWRTILQKDLEAYYLDAVWDEGALYPAGGGTFDGTSAYVTVPEELPVDTWSYLAVTYDGTMLRLYVNGEETSSTPQIGRPQANANPLQIGGSAYEGEYFAGQIDEVRIYNRALSPSEIQADMRTPVK